MRYIDGDYIPLMWECTPDDFIVKGHIDFKTALEILDAEQDVSTYYELGEPSHKYARWSCEPSWDDGISHTLRTYKESGRGRFKVTVFPVKSRKEEIC